MRINLLVCALALPALLAGCGNVQDGTTQGATGGFRAPGEVVYLPPPKASGGLSLEEAMNRRMSRRDIGGSPLSLSEIGQLLWAAGGIRVDGVSGATRTAPSAGGIYPLQLYLVCGGSEDLATGVYRYDHSSHSLAVVSLGDRRGDLARAALGQDFISRAPASVVITADYGKTERRYGQRGARYVHLDAGCASQNLELQAVALGLGTVAVGAFADDEVASVLGTENTPLLILPVGRPTD